MRNSVAILELYFNAPYALCVLLLSGLGKLFALQRPLLCCPITDRLWEGTGYLCIVRKKNIQQVVEFVWLKPLSIDRIHKWRPRTHSFVFVLIILTSRTLTVLSFVRANEASEDDSYKKEKNNYLAAVCEYGLY